MLEQALSVAAAKAKLAGLVVAAAAVGGTAAVAGSTGFVPTAGEEAAPVVSASPTTDPTVTPTVEPTVDPTQAAPTASAEATPVVCPTDLANHGEYVRSVAQDKTLKGREHGKAVSEAARSDCGKKAGEDADAEESPEPTVSEAAETESDDADDADDATRAPKPEKAHGKKNR